MSKAEFVAEIGLNHDGNFDLNYELIKAAKWAGADIAKFQLGWRGGQEEMNFLDLERLQTLKKWCDEFEIEFMVSVFTEDAWDLAQKIDFSRYKIASRTVVDNPDLCQKIIASKKEVIVSLGMYEGAELPFSGDNVHYLYCVSKYPTRHEDLKSMPEKFGAKYWGYSDHCQGIEACLTALSRGAHLIEKHFTLNKTSKVIRDHSLSATPYEFRQLTELGREIAKLNQKIAK